MGFSYIIFKKLYWWAYINLRNLTEIVYSIPESI